MKAPFYSHKRFGWFSINNNDPGLELFAQGGNKRVGRTFIPK
jgi:hypothetical protein